MFWPGCWLWRLAVLVAVIMLSPQSQTDRESAQYAPRYSTASVHVYVPCNARLVTVTGWICVSATLPVTQCDCKRILPSLVCTLAIIRVGQVDALPQ